VSDGSNFALEKSVLPSSSTNPFAELLDPFPSCSLIPKEGFYIVGRQFDFKKRQASSKIPIRIAIDLGLHDLIYFHPGHFLFVESNQL
jgi:hypothetical protein